jgi:enoyl-CoA hydratase/carnithine racemase
MAKLEYEKRDRIAYVMINRPEAKNAIDPDVHRLMVETWADFRDDDAVDVAILTGAGDAFCAGADLKTYIPQKVGGATPADIREIVELGLNGFTRGMHRIDKPIIAAVNGWALAGGLETAMAADIRVASERAAFGSFEARRGFHHGDGGLVRLVNTCGVGVAMEMLLTAEPIDAQRALQCNRVHLRRPGGDFRAAGAFLRQDRPRPRRNPPDVALGDEPARPAQPTSSGSSSASSCPASRERPRRTAARNFSRLTSRVERISSA